MSNSNSKLFVHGFLNDMDQEARISLINELFTKYGEVKDIAFIPNREYGGLKSFGFIQMDSDESAETVIENLDGYEDKETGLKLSISVAKPREDNRPSGGYNNGGRRNFRNGGGKNYSNSGYRGNSNYGYGGNSNGAGNQDW